MKAKTIVEISGHCIPTIPVGTEFEVSLISDHGYALCKGLPVSSVWKDEYTFIDLESQDANSVTINHQ